MGVPEEKPTRRSWRLSVVAIAVGVLAVFVTQKESARADRAADASRQVLERAAAQVVSSVEKTDLSLEADIAQTLARLRRVSQKAEAFEAEVREGRLLH